MAALRTGPFNVIFLLLAVTSALLLASTLFWRLNSFSLTKYETILKLYQLPVGVPVRLQAVVTYADPVEKRFWIQDDTGAIAINDDPSIYSLRGGESIRLEGRKILFSDPLSGATSVSVSHPRITSIRSNFKLPAPATVSFRTLPENEKTGIRVQLTGVVRKITRDQFGRIHLALGDAGQEIPATVGVGQGDTSLWLNAKVRLVGVAESTFADNGRSTYKHIWIQSEEDVRLQEGAPQSEPLYSIRTLYRDSSSRDGHRVRFRGRVTGHRGARYVLLADRWGVIACDFDEPQTIQVGTPVEVTGFPTTDGLLIDLFHSSVREIPEQLIGYGAHEAALAALKTVSSIRILDEEQARAALPVKLTGVITYCDTDWRNLFFQDSTGGIYVKYSDRMTPLARGERVTVTGITDAGDYAPTVVAATLIVLGKGKLPKPIPATSKDASSGILDSQFVKVEGVIHPMNKGQNPRHVRFELYSAFGPVEVFTGPAILGAYLRSIEGANVAIQGVLGTLFNSNRQLAGYHLSVTSSDDFKILELAESNPFGKAAIPISGLLRFSPQADLIHRVKVRGSVTMIGRGFFYMQDDGGGLEVVGDPRGLQLSDVVEAVGYPSPSGSYSPALTDALVRVIGHGRPVLPTALTAESALQGQFDSRLGTIDARLLSVSDTANGTNIVMSSGALTFNAQIDGLDPTQLPSLQEGSLLRLTGVCSIQVDHGKLYLLLEQAPLGFTLLIPSPRDIKILKPPDWWSASHALAVFGILLATICAALGWVTILRRRVRRQAYALNVASEKAKAIRDLSHAMEDVTVRGNFAKRVSIGASDEIGHLGVQFNAMVLELQQRDLGKKEAEARLRYQALTDELTGLPNRRLLSDRLQQNFAIAKRKGQILALLYVDLDGFKLVNDSLGHTVGDLLLGKVAERLQSRIRKSDTLARLGGDEFTMVLTSLHNKDEAGLVARGVLEVLARPFLIESHEINISASIGISSFPDHGDDAATLLQRADSAMYAAKRNGKNQVMYFTPEIGSSVQERLSLENQLRGAMGRGEIVVHYQPEFDVHSNELVRFEALARWIHPTLGTIAPSKFIPIAEESGLIIPLGAYIMEHACAEARRWTEISHHPIQIAVNVSSLQFMRETFVAEVTGILRDTGLNPKLLQIELTESIMTSGTERAARVMKELRALKISIAIDDFGTGYSCLRYLPRLPFNALKIDRSFVKELELRPGMEAMVRSLVTLAHNLNMQVIVEGIETPQQLEMIQTLGANEVQGFLLGRPTPDPQSEIRSRQNSTEVAHRDEYRKSHVSNDILKEAL